MIGRLRIVRTVYGNSTINWYEFLEYLVRLLRPIFLSVENARFTTNQPGLLLPNAHNPV